MRIYLTFALTLAVLGVVRPEQLAAQSAVEVEAVRGEPFGVGRITLRSGGDLRIQLPRRNGPRRGGRILDLARRIAEQTAGPATTTSLETTDVALVERSGRIFYPVFQKRERPLLREFIDVPKEVTVYFLFTGEAPLELTLYAPDAQRGQIVPRRDPEAYQRLLQGWWRDYSAAGTRSTPQDFPPVVEEYLVDTLARRLRLPLAERAPANQSSVLARELNLLAGTEQARQEIARAILLAGPERQTATEPVPVELPPPQPEVLNPAEAAVEPLAMRVPIECLYVRFGSFSNFQWLRHRLDEWGGELRDIVSERGFDYGLNGRMERQLGIRESKAAELLGESVIADVALIGTDTFLREGAAIGILFQAKNSLALTADFTQQRAAVVKDTPGAKLEAVKIGGRPVSLISTPDNSVRSFYASDGEFQLITTSRTLVEWFFATGAGKHDSLGASEAFRRARRQMPLERKDTVFAYLSPAFFQNLLSAHYQIELVRRMQSSVQIELVRIARLAARGEGHPVESVDDLIRLGYLPEGFGQRWDDSQLVVAGALVGDSLRGAPGSFLPIPDVKFERATPDEVRAYRQFAESYASSWGGMDPIVAGIRRESLPGGKLERVILDAQAAPLSERHIQMLSQWLGPPTNQKLAPIEGDVVSFQAVMRGGSFFAGEPHHLFGALRDADPAVALDPRVGLIGRLLAAQFQGLQGYLGAWPNPGYLQLLGGIVETPVDPAGYSRSLAGVWRRQFDGFTLLSLEPQTIELVSRQLRFEQVERPAQIWLRADDLANSKLAGFINAYGYRQSRQMALGNARFMNMLVEQLHVPAADALATAEKLLDARLLEPLGGKYQLVELPTGQTTWTSTSLVDQPNASSPPADYQFPALNWMRGVDFELVTDGDQLAVHGELVMPVETKSSGFQLPSLPFGLSKPAKSPDKTGPKSPAGGDSPQPSGKREF
jgi:hypothetical protein